MNQSNKVQLYLYDLSQGAARQMSQQFLGIQIDGIWHTGIVIFGKEYYFGGGICQGIPGQTPYGSPIQKIELGDSQVTQEVFHHYLESIRPQYVIETYDLFTHNCNNFTDECSNFLLGQGIPKYITDLPNQVLRTPLGQMIKPMIDGFTNQMNQQSISQSMFPPGQTDLRQNINNEQTQQNNVIDISSFEQFLEILENNKGVVIDFYSLQCPPCLRIKPIFANLANQFKNICPELKFCAVNVTKVKDLGNYLYVQSKLYQFLYAQIIIIRKFRINYFLWKSRTIIQIVNFFDQYFCFEKQESYSL